MGCDMVQGYLFSRPLPARDLPALLGRRIAREVGPAKPRRPVRRSAVS
jgi:predicted signal transduction protein with EAL and GGDEF domain